MESILAIILVVVLLALMMALILRGFRIVPQGNVYVVERLGKYTRTLSAGLHMIVPFLERVRGPVPILERQVDARLIQVITRDNVAVPLEVAVFYRVVEAEKSVYRIDDVDEALKTEVTSIVRSAVGEMELDDLQSSRESMIEEIENNLQNKADEWGVMITSTAIKAVLVDDETKEAQRQQLNAERERRAIIARAEGDKRSLELAAEAKLYEAQKEAEAVRVAADADAYAVRVVGEAIADNGQPAVDFVVLKRQVEAMGQLASSENAKTVIMPTEIAGVIGSLKAVFDSVGRRESD